MPDPIQLPPLKPATPHADAPVTSPTGQPMLSPKLAPYLFVLVTLCGCLAGASQLDLGLPPKVFGWAVLGGMFFGSLLAATPGFRKGGGQ